MEGSSLTSNDIDCFCSVHLFLSNHLIQVPYAKTTFRLEFVLWKKCAFFLVVVRCPCLSIILIRFALNSYSVSTFLFNIFFYDILGACRGGGAPNYVLSGICSLEQVRIFPSNWSVVHTCQSF